MAKPGGKAGGKRKDKRADQDKDNKRAKPGKAPQPGRKDTSRKDTGRKDTGRKDKGAALAANGVAAATGPKASKPKRAKGATQLLVERVAEEIVMAEYDRAVNGSAPRESAEAETEAEAPEAEVEVAETAVSAVAAGAVVKQAAGVKQKSSVKAGKAVGASKAASTSKAVGAGTAVSASKSGSATKAVSASKSGSATKAASASKAGGGSKAAKAASVKAPGVVEVGAGEVGSGGAGGAEGDGASVGPLSDLLRLPGGPVDLGAFDTAGTPGVSSREKAEAQLPKLAAQLNDLQERLFAAARGGDSNRRVLLVLQGMDTSGKGGTVRHVVGQLDPNGIRVTAFKAPTEEERAHDFLWRIRNALPVAGEVGIFDRSHYEDVLIARVHKLALPMVIGKRYQLINRFEQNLVADGAVLVKCFLHISPDEQRNRLLTRLDDPTKHWKYNPSDVDERALWPEYQEAYRLALEKCSTEGAPWYVIPADHKWYRNYAITRLLLEALERIDPVYPSGAFDVEVERKRLLGG